MIIQDTGIVLRVNNYKDRDIVCSMLCKEHGRLSLFAKNARGSKKRFSGGIDIFDCAQFSLSKKKFIQNYNKIELWHLLSSSPKLFSLSSFCIEIVLALSEDSQKEAKEFFMPLFLSLRTLNSSKELETQKSIAIFFTIKILNISGFGLPETQEHEINEYIGMITSLDKPVQPKDQKMLDQMLSLVKNRVMDLSGKEIRSLYS